MTTQVQSHVATQTEWILPASRDDGISRLAEERLRNSSYSALRTISCEYHEGVLILRGRLHTYYLKQLAQEAVREMDGVLEIANQVHVVDPVRPKPGRD
jgi:osmotically-inducible protein OsmY